MILALDWKFVVLKNRFAYQRARQNNNIAKQQRQFKLLKFDKTNYRNDFSRDIIKLIRYRNTVK